MSSSDAAANLGQALAREREQQKERDVDLGAQLDAIATQLRTEKRISDDRFETLNSKLDRILAKLTTNGSGGHNG